MSYIILLSGPEHAGKRNLAARIANELAGRKVNVLSKDDNHDADGKPLRIHPDGVRLVISDAPQSLCPANRQCDPEELFVEMHVILPDSNTGAAGAPEVVVHARRDGLKTGLNRILHFLETRRLVPEKKTESVYSDLFSAVTGSTTQLAGPPR